MELSWEAGVERLESGKVQEEKPSLPEGEIFFPNPEKQCKKNGYNFCISDLLLWWAYVDMELGFNRISPQVPMWLLARSEDGWSLFSLPA